MPKLDNKYRKLSCQDVTVIAPHFKKRLSGVTTSVAALLPIQSKMGLNIVALGPGLPDNLPRLAWKSIFYLWKKPNKHPFRIWHARRNSELLIGLLLRDIFRLPLRVIFTFATQKKTSTYKKWLLTKADYTIATSDKNSLLLDVPHKVIMHGVDLDKFFPSENKINLLKTLNINGNLAIGCFGRIRPSKGTDIFVDTMIALLPHYRDWVALIIGRTTKSNQKFLAKLKEKICQHQLEHRILFFEEKVDIACYYRALSLFVSPSHSEGFGLTVLEAMASSSAVVASNVGAFPKLITKDTGILVEKIDPYHFTKAIEPFLKDSEKTQQMGKNARKFVIENFSLEKEAKSLQKLYQALWKNEI